MQYEVKINDFEGPLDLLLHLIKKQNIDIYEINLETITKQYFDYIKQMEQLNLDVASEYLVMAAELIEIKSRSLLPKNESNDEDDYEEDPKEELIRKLVDYKKYKEVTETFKQLEIDRGEMYTKIPSDLTDYSDNKIIKKDDLSVVDLYEAFQKFLNRKELEKPLKTTVTKKELSLKDRVSDIKKILYDKKQVSFNELFEIKTRNYIVVTFLAVLEMSKKQEIDIKQENNFENIFIILKGENR